MSGQANAPTIEALIEPGDSGRDRQRLRAAHAALLRAGPLPELPDSMRRPPAVTISRLGVTPAARPRRVLLLAATIAAVIVAAVAASAFLRDNAVGPAQGAVAMHATAAAPNAKGVLRIGRRDSSGNWPITLRVRGMPPLARGSYYQIYLTDKGRLVGSCGVFRTNGGPTLVHLNVPYTLGEYSGWLIRRHHANRPASKPLMTSQA